MKLKWIRCCAVLWVSDDKVLIVIYFSCRLRIIRDVKNEKLDFSSYGKQDDELFNILILGQFLDDINFTIY